MNTESNRSEVINHTMKYNAKDDDEDEEVDQKAAAAAADLPFIDFLSLGSSS